ncbi:unnamed protein product, partial [Rotaria sp. Silwood2]
MKIHRFLSLFTMNGRYMFNVSPSERALALNNSNAADCSSTLPIKKNALSQSLKSFHSQFKQNPYSNITNGNSVPDDANCYPDNAISIQNKAPEVTYRSWTVR